MDKVIVGELLEGEYICEVCANDSSVTEACPHRQAQLEAVLEAHYKVRYVPWWVDQESWVEPGTVCRCGHLIDECAVCGLDCRCQNDPPACYRCVNQNAYEADDDTLMATIEEVLEAALADKVIVKYTRAYPSSWYQPILTVSLG